jgi:hypothetical protein
MWSWLCAALGLVAAPALADEKQVCNEAYAQAQTLRDAHKLLQAREQLRICARSVCPGFVASDCAKWLGEVQDVIPTVLFSAKDGAGADLVNVKATMDGLFLSSTMTGVGIEVDPGPHMFVFEAPDGSRVEKKAVVLEGRRNQIIEVILAAPPVTAVPSPPPVVQAAKPEIGPYNVPPPPVSPRSHQLRSMEAGSTQYASLLGGGPVQVDFVSTDPSVRWNVYESGTIPCATPCTRMLARTASVGMAPIGLTAQGQPGSNSNQVVPLEGLQSADAHVEARASQANAAFLGGLVGGGGLGGGAAIAGGVLVGVGSTGEAGAASLRTPGIAMLVGGLGVLAVGVAIAAIWGHGNRVELVPVDP